MPKLTQREKNRVTTAHMEFPKMKECWEHTDDNKKMFKFDDAVEKFTNDLGISEDESGKFFCFYKVYSRFKSLPRYFTIRLATKTEMFHLDLYFRAHKMDELELIGKRIPKPKYYDDLPEVVTPKYIFAQKKLDRVSTRDMIGMFNAIGRCIQKRIDYRNDCVNSRKIKGQQRHDEFILILQILRANIYTEVGLRNFNFYN